MPESNVTMPFTGESQEDLHKVLSYIANSPLSVELFDVFIAAYARTSNLHESLFMARSEWDC